MRTLFCTILFSFSVLLQAQEVRLSVQTGHSATVNALDYNSDHSLIASASSDNKVVVWHVETGKQFGSYIGHTDKVTDVVFHPEKNLMYSVSMDSSLIVWNVGTNEMVEQIKYDFPLGALDVRADGKELAIAGHALILRDLESKKDNKFKLISRKLFTTIAYSPNSKWVALGGKDEKLGYVIDLNEKAVVSKFLASMNDVVFEVGGPSIYYATETGVIVHFDFYRNKIEGSTNKSEWNSFNAVRVSEDYIIGANDEAEIIVFNKDNWKKEVILKAHLQGVRALDFNSESKHLISAGVDQRIIMWDLERQEMIRSFQSKIYRISDIQFSENGEDIVVGFANGFVRRTNLLTNTSYSNRSQLSQFQIEKGFQYLLTDLVYMDEKSAKFDMLMLRNSMENEGTYNLLKDLQLVWLFKENKIVLTELSGKSERVQKYVSAVKKNQRPRATSLLNPDLLSTENDKIRASIKGKTLLINDKSSGKELMKIALDHTDRVTSVAINSKFNYVATASWDGMIKFWSLETGELMSTFGAFSGSDFVYLNSDKYYFASKRALEHIGFVSNGNLFSFDQFDLKYNRPDLVFGDLPFVEEKTVENYHLAYKKRLSKLGLTEESLTISEDIPQIQLKGKTGATSYDGYYDYSFTAKDEASDLKSYHVLVNGVPIFGRGGKTIKGTDLAIEKKIRLTPGPNQIKFYVTNEKGVSSFKKTVDVVSKEKAVRSELYLVTMGCSNYQQSDYNLNYAEKDASDIMEFFSESKEFDQIHQMKLVNEQVTKKDADGITTFISNANENDVVLVFVAGHGVLDANLDYFIATHDMDFNDPAEKGIPFSFFDDLLDGTKSRKKLMFIDACHSGEIDKSEVAIDETVVEEEGDVSFRNVGAGVKNVNDVNSFELSKIAFADVRESNGSSVLSSAGGGEFAMEGEEWSNGVFTFALLSGLQTGEADLNQDKTVKISELYAYLTYKVNKITGGRQTPTSRIENLANDFIIH